MKRFWFACVIVLGLTFATPSLAQDRPAGLQFTPRDEYQSIPLASNPFAGDDLPSAVDLSQYMPPPGDQENQNSCVGWAVAYAVKSYHEQREARWNYFEAGGRLNQDRVFSPSYVYNQINNGLNVGTHFPHALNLVAEQGASPWSAMPYTRFDAPVTSSARQVAKKYRIDTWRRVNPQAPHEVKAQLRAGFPVMIGAEFDEGFQRLGRGQMWRERSGAVKGGHAMVVVGYDDQRGAYKLINSWGTSWGDGGYIWVTYDHFARVVREAYVAQDAINGPSEQANVEPVPEPRTQTPNFQPIETAAAQATITVGQVIHNQMAPGMGPGAVINGMVQIPSGVQGHAQVVIAVTFQNGMLVGSLDSRFALPNGQAATSAGPGVMVMPSATPQMIPWQAFLPYCALNVPKGVMCLPFQQGPPQTSWLMAHTSLFINGFGVAEGQPQAFPLTL